MALQAFVLQWQTNLEAKDEDVDPSPEQVSYSLENVGHIKLKVSCGRLDGKHSVDGFSPTEAFDQPKEVVKDNHISLSTR